GQLANNSTTSDIAVNDQLLKAVDYRPLIVGYSNGAAIRLGDVANVQDSVENLRSAGLANGKPCALVIMVVFVFLRNPRATIIPAVVVPVSLIGTFGVMYLCHYSLDKLSLMALT